MSAQIGSKSHHPRIARQRSRVGQQAFASEACLVDAIRRMFDDGRSADWAWLKEFSTPGGTADLVAVSLKRNWPQNRSLSLIPSRWLYPLKNMPLGSMISAGSFAADFGISATTARGILGAYADAGYCAYSESDRAWVKRKDLDPLSDRIVAIEAKLRDWRRALYQAVQYASFASESWVVIDAHYAQSVDVEEFKRRHIGLISLSNAGDCDVLFQPAPGMPRMPERYWQANGEILRRLLIAGTHEKTC